MERLGRPSLVAQTHRVLADLTRATDPEVATGHLQRCLELEKPLGHPELRAGCLWTLSLLDAAREPRRAERASRAAIDALAVTPNSPLLVYAWQARLRLAWQTMPEDAAMPASLQALDAVERLRARQQDDSSRAALFSHWTRDYYWLAGRLLQAETPRLPQAFEVGERLRARVLLDHLARAGMVTADERVDADRTTAGRRVQQRVVDAQRRLLALDPEGSEHRRVLDELHLLEIQERELGMAGSAPAARPVTFASLAEVQQALDDTEALLWYSLAPWEDVYGDFGGGAWLVSVTRAAARVHRLPSSVDSRSQVATLVGLLRDRELPAERWAPAAARLGRTLLGPAVSELPAGIRRLVIVSDGDLHALPFEALAPSSDVPRLGERFDVTLVPSATLVAAPAPAAGGPAVSRGAGARRSGARAWRPPCPTVGWRRCPGRGAKPMRSPAHSAWMASRYARARPHLNAS